MYMTLLVCETQAVEQAAYWRDEDTCENDKQHANVATLPCRISHNHCAEDKPNDVKNYKAFHSYRFLTQRFS